MKGPPSRRMSSRSDGQPSPALTQHVADASTALSSSKHRSPSVLPLPFPLPSSASCSAPPRAAPSDVGSSRVHRQAAAPSRLLRALRSDELCASEGARRRGRRAGVDMYMWRRDGGGERRRGRSERRRRMEAFRLLFAAHSPFNFSIVTCDKMTWSREKRRCLTGTRLEELLYVLRDIDESLVGLFVLLEQPARQESATSKCKHGEHSIHIQSDRWDGMIFFSFRTWKEVSPTAHSK